MNEPSNRADIEEMYKVSISYLGPRKSRNLFFKILSRVHICILSLYKIKPAKGPFINIALSFFACKFKYLAASIFGK